MHALALARIDLSPMKLSWLSPAPNVAPLTPCIGVCTLRDDGLCEGCLRTGAEIGSWSTLDAEQRLQIMNEVLPGRRRDRR